MGTLIGIATREKRRAPMDTHTNAAITFDQGVGQDSRGVFRNKRQVTILSVEAWQEACRELGTDMHWTTRRANFLTEGIDLRHTTGKKLRVGSCLLEITGELEPCKRMDEQYPGLTKILTPDWRGGVTCKILEEGHVSLEDEIVFVA